MLHVLVVEDDDQYQGVYRKLLEQQGDTFAVVASRDAARTAWRAGRFDAVILDKRLQGAAGPDDGVDLLAEARFHGAKTILITGYADDESIRRAFELGAHEYLEKSAVLPALLRIKLDQIQTLVRTRQRGLPANHENIQQAWAQLGEGTAHAKGRRLEDLVSRLLESVQGFIVDRRNLRTETEELDLVLRNESQDPFWIKLPPYLLVESKNWSSKVGTPELAWFADKLRERPEARLGLFIAPGGFSKSVDDKALSYRKEGLTMVLVDRPDLEALVHARSDQRTDLLKALHSRWAVG